MEDGTGLVAWTDLICCNREGGDDYTEVWENEDEFEIHSDSITASRRCLVIVP